MGKDLALKFLRLQTYFRTHCQGGDFIHHHSTSHYLIDRETSWSSTGALLVVNAGQAKMAARFFSSLLRPGDWTACLWSLGRGKIGMSIVDIQQCPKWHGGLQCWLWTVLPHLTCMALDHHTFRSVAQVCFFQVCSQYPPTFVFSLCFWASSFP